jgi:hypothetical protein
MSPTDGNNSNKMKNNSTNGLNTRQAEHKPAIPSVIDNPMPHL